MFCSAVLCDLSDFVVGLFERGLFAKLCLIFWWLVAVFVLLLLLAMSLASLNYMYVIVVFPDNTHSHFHILDLFHSCTHWMVYCRHMIVTIPAGIHFVGL